MTAGRAALEQVLTEDAFARARTLGARMADGLEAAIADAGLPWSVLRMGPHALLRVRARARPQGRGLPRGRRPRPAGADPRVDGEPRGVGIGMVAGAYGVGGHPEPDIERDVELFRTLLAELT